MSVEAALRAAGVPVAIAKREAPGASAAMQEFGITTQREAAAFLAQVLHESCGLRYFEEIASGAAYEGRRDLGNVQRGDGRRYKGRGPIQLTGRANYRTAGRAMHVNLEAHPELAARHSVGWRIAGWYWQTRGLDRYADGTQQGFDQITRRINGGYNGKADRDRIWRRVRDLDCRPGAQRPADETRWIKEYDRLVKANKDEGRRLSLRAAMRRRRKAIWQAAQKGGWEKANRRARYKSLLARTT